MKNLIIIDIPNDFVADSIEKYLKSKGYFWASGTKPKKAEYYKLGFDVGPYGKDGHLYYNPVTKTGLSAVSPDFQKELDVWLNQKAGVEFDVHGLTNSFRVTLDRTGDVTVGCTNLSLRSVQEIIDTRKILLSQKTEGKKSFFAVTGINDDFIRALVVMLFEKYGFNRSDLYMKARNIMACKSSNYISTAVCLNSDSNTIYIKSGDLNFEQVFKNWIENKVEAKPVLYKGDGVEVTLNPNGDVVVKGETIPAKSVEHIIAERQKLIS